MPQTTGPAAPATLMSAHAPAPGGNGVERDGRDHERAPGRYLFYSHDSFGLGHLRRTLVQARGIMTADPRGCALIVTGSTVASSFRLPPRVDIVQLPAVTKDEDGCYRAARLGVDLDEVLDLRRAIARATARAFAPTVAVIDKAPLGVGGELRPMLAELRTTRCQVVLGLRDIEDRPSAVRREWRRAGMRDVLRRFYDTVLVYGPDSCADAIRCMGWRNLGIPVHYVGYVGAEIPGSAPADLPRDYLLITVGGGQDGFEVLLAAARAIRDDPLSCPTLIVTGPMMEQGQLNILRGLVGGLDVRVERFRTDMEAVVGGARAVVAMAGYNTVAEVVRARKPALFVPRVRPREEQLLRAQGLAIAGCADMLHPNDLSPRTMRAALSRLLECADPAWSPHFRHDGAQRTAQILCRLSAERPAHLGMAA